MTHFQFMSLLGVMVAGLCLIKFGWKKTGTLIFCWGMYMFLMFMPWTTFDALMKSNARFRHWALPRIHEIRLYWCAGSLLFSGLVGLVMVCKKAKGGKDPRWEEPGGENGLDEALAAALEKRSKLETTFLGLAHGREPVTIPPAARGSHMQIVGPTRSGKSQLLFALAAQDMRRDMPVFFMEAKGDHSDFDQFLAMSERCGRLEDVRYFNPQDSRSMTFNPIRRLPGQDANAVANQIARVIGREPTASGEAQEYHLNNDFARIQAMAEVFCRTGLEFTLRDCYYYFSYVECRQKAFGECGSQRLADAAKRELERNPDTTGLTSAIRPWTTGTLGRLLNTYSPQITLDEVFRSGQLAYFAIPIGYLPIQANPLGRMVISGLLAVATWRQQSRRKPGPGSVILDEFSEFATPAFASFISTVGSARIHTILSHQDLGQLRKVVGTDAESFASAVFNNSSGCKVCFRTPDPEDAEFWSQVIGTYTTQEDTE
ncbi:MAG: TraM recognition domain-containing protein, partial [Elusimicrobia bacterium]|nr:TraM recognition domain-containing protein [Elusimicrobiota bacterium]